MTDIEKKVLFDMTPLSSSVAFKNVENIARVKVSEFFAMFLTSLALVHQDQHVNKLPNAVLHDDSSREKPIVRSKSSLLGRGFGHVILTRYEFIRGLRKWKGKFASENGFEC